MNYVCMIIDWMLNYIIRHQKHRCAEGNSRVKSPPKLYGRPRQNYITKLGTINCCENVVHQAVHSTDNMGSRLWFVSYFPPFAQPDRPPYDAA